VPGLLVSSVAGLSGQSINSGAACRSASGSCPEDDTVLLQLGSEVRHRSQGSAKFLPNAYEPVTELAATYGDNNFECKGNATDLPKGGANGLYFRCFSGKCVHYGLRCDGAHDCDDGTDEFACGHSRNPALIGDLELSFMNLSDQTAYLRSVSSQKLAQVRTLKYKLQAINRSLGSDYNALDAILRPTQDLQKQAWDMKAQQSKIDNEIDIANNKSKAFHEKVLRESSNNTELLAKAWSINASYQDIQDQINSLVTQSTALHNELSKADGTAQ